MTTPGAGRRRFGASNIPLLIIAVLEHVFCLQGIFLQSGLIGRSDVREGCKRNEIVSSKKIACGNAR